MKGFGGFNPPSYSWLSKNHDLKDPMMQRDFPKDFQRKIWVIVSGASKRRSKPDMTKNGRITQLLAAGIDTALPMNNRTIDGVN
jgi:hypothetical protein